MKKKKWYNEAPLRYVAIVQYHGQGPGTVVARFLTVKDMLAFDARYREHQKDNKDLIMSWWDDDADKWLTF